MHRGWKMRLAMATTTQVKLAITNSFWVRIQLRMDAWLAVIHARFEYRRCALGDWSLVEW
jgi:hypothetical protein